MKNAVDTADFDSAVHEIADAETRVPESRRSLRAVDLPPQAKQRSRRLRILLLDYSGHPFQAQLSRALARRGHEVLHVFSARFQSPKGNLARQKADPAGFNIEGLQISGAFAKDSFLKRRAQEIEFGNLVADRMRTFAPQVVLCSNAPVDVQRKVLQATRRQGASFVFWLQDIWSEAMVRILPKRIPLLGHAVARYYVAMEYGVLRQSERIVSISDGFVPFLKRHGVDESRVVTIENWAPLDEIAPMERDNAWARVNMPTQGVRVVYSGTLGYKHNPRLLLDAAKAMGPAGHVYVFSEGAAANALAEEARDSNVENITVAPWVPFEKLADMLSGADIFVAMIEAEAGVFSVPSKVLSYLCIGRPIVAAIPEGNLARQIIARQDAGLVSSPDDGAAFVKNLQALVRDPGQRERLGANGRAYAQSEFDIDRIVRRFETVLYSAHSEH